MNEDLIKKIEAQDAKLDLIYKSTEKTRKYILWAVVFTIVATVLPLAGLLFVIPSYLNTLSSSLGI
ncbi:MAG: hypothetical protein EXS50_01560 [Candidatus Taylorbacteria bacterium]|nr:hypothetical protein [Candidatus Taylorbacteria bacterium]